MTRQEKGKAIDYHKNSTNISIRINNDLLTLFDTKREKEGKTYKNFVVKSYNKIEKKEENEEE